MNTGTLKKKSIDSTGRHILYSLVTLLVFEGLFRKLVPALNFPIFFAKDILCIWALYILAEVKYKNIVQINLLRGKVALAFLPILLYTATYDPILSIFGAKQYLLYIIVAVLVPVSFPIHRQAEFRKFFAYAALLIIPTSLVAIIENALPASHWLNLSVDGSSLEDFSAGGFLRVSSTFSFTGQYSFFLMAACAFFAIRFFMPPAENSKKFKLLKKILPFILGILLVIGTFITGGRTAVLGCGASVVIGVALIIVKKPKFLLPSLVGLCLLAGVFLVAKEIKPEFFAAYEQRSDDNSGGSAAVADRVVFGFLGWTKWFNEQEFIETFLGNGLGVMSNGSQKISSYAEQRRLDFWTETDLATTAWEGGVYLIFVWYLFRLTIIFYCFKLWKSLVNDSYRSAGAFIFAFILINGVMGTLSLQPPIAIWLWLMVGAMITIKSFDTNLNSTKKN